MADNSKKSKKNAVKAEGKILPKASAKKTPLKTGKTAGRTGKGGEWAALAKELRSLIPRLDSEGLSFLIEQAQVHLYNLQAEELNRATARSGAAKPARGGNSFRLEKSSSGSSYYIVYRNDWIMFSKDEMARITRIVSAPVTELEIREQLYRWFERERRDVLVSIPMADKFDENLKALIALIKKTCN
jgi:hypothetical protein